jgi:hypothetical protein
VTAVGQSAVLVGSVGDMNGIFKTKANAIAPLIIPA